jgi:hypothetical protein
MRPSAILNLSEQQREQASDVIERFSGGRVPLLEGGWKFEHYSLPPEDPQLLQTGSFYVRCAVGSMCRRS